MTSRRASKYSMTESKRERWTKEGRGQGEGEDYVPYFRRGDVPSRGLTWGLEGVKINRYHVFLSENERRTFEIVEHSDVWEDLKEQYPLSLEKTTQYAKDLGIKHPTDSRTGVLRVVTIDLLILAKGGKKVAWSVKPLSEIVKYRTAEKLELERFASICEGFEWSLIVDMDIPSTSGPN